ncbi:hypothetical protein, partial [Streptomyces sp. NPDC055140]
MDALAARWRKEGTEEPTTGPDATDAGDQPQTSDGPVGTTSEETTQAGDTGADTVTLSPDEMSDQLDAVRPGGSKAPSTMDDAEIRDEIVELMGREMANGGELSGVDRTLLQVLEAEEARRAGRAPKPEPRPKRTTEEPGGLFNVDKPTTQQPDTAPDLDKPEDRPDDLFGTPDMFADNEGRDTEGLGPARMRNAAELDTPAIVLADDWALPLPDLGTPHSTESAAAAWAIRGVLSDYQLIALIAAVDDDDAFARWKSRHMRHHGEGTGQINKDLAPADGVSHKHSAKQFQARIAGQTVTLTWDRVRAWLSDAITPEALSLLQAADEAGDRLRAGRRGDALFAAAGELDRARELRAQVKRLTTQVLDHVVQFMATTAVPAAGRGRHSALVEDTPGFFEVTPAPVFELPGADTVLTDLNRLIAYLPDPLTDRDPESVPLSQLRAGMVLDQGDDPVVITEIIRHPGRCDIVGEFRGPIRPARIKHSVHIADDDPDPRVRLAPSLPSLYALTGQEPELD